MPASIVAALLTFASEPPVVATASPPSIVAISSAPAAASAPLLLELKLSSDAGPIWQGVLRVGSGGASISQNRSEAPAAACEPSTRYESLMRSSFNINLNLSRRTDQRDALSVNVGWTRPVSEGCDKAGSRTVQLQQSLTLPAGEDVVVRGDAGLTLVIRRR